MNPKVSFVIPCYKLAYLLPDCVHSVLAQTYRDFEVLIMDDCSPDHTPEVAKSFQDPRVKHIRNEPNLGHVSNFNKGIGLARGKYVWLISADDRLRRPYILERYLDVMERHPEIGYACCPAMEIWHGKETGVAKYSVQARHDTIFRGHKFLNRLMDENCVVAASALVRKTCYESLGLFPLDLPYSGDWYTWCLLALHYDVAYFAEPMVGYRLHEESMTSQLMAQQIRVCVDDELTVLWRIKEKAQEMGGRLLVNKCRSAVALEHAKNIMGQYKAAKYSMSLEECEGRLQRFARSAAEVRWIRARIYAFLAEGHFRQQNFVKAVEFYRYALGEDPWMAKVWVKRLLLHTGALGVRIRQSAVALRQILSGKSALGGGYDAGVE